MKAKDKLNLTELFEIYLFANTPMYLYRRFRDSSSVHELASSFSASDLLIQYTEIAQKTDKTVEDVVTAYALLVAIGVKNYNEIKGLLDKIQTKGLDWASYIVQIIRETSKITQEVYINANQRFRFPINDSSRNVSNNTLKIKFRPKLSVEGI